MREVASSDLPQQALGLHRVGKPADRALQRLGVGVRRVTDSRSSTPSPPATKTGARSQPPCTPCSSSQSPSSSSTVGGLQRGERRGVPDLLDELLLGHHQLLQLSRRPASRPRSWPACAACRRPGRAARRPRGPRRRPGCSARGSARPTACPGPAAAPARRTAGCSGGCPRIMPSSRCTAIGNQRANSVAKSAAGNVSTAQSVTARTDGAVDPGPSRRRGRTARRRSRPRAGRCGWSRPGRRRSSGSSTIVPESSTKKQVAGCPSVMIARRRGSRRRAVGGDPGQLVLGQVGEQEQLAQPLRGQVLAGIHLRTHWSARYRCTSVTAIAPSPTAEATRLTESARTSPATNTPGTLDSRW